ncbi:heme A synthase [Alteromonas aestuariivivens]|uniref:Heme A synthase n=1 Tax=Alteromonas aestuariivivens TaxID=1938339 RepID=A0A3D8M532_9ALTE|nr:COX15/CtaA family protein [Alteromonas aestuariivivens]RDV24843.1 heme A synthase [Alteromonas aestuariivivens]
MKKLVLVSIFLALTVIILGAYTRLTDAGLGCPDWPGCYGHLTVPQSDAQLASAEAAFPTRPVDAHKAWNEMIHRYFAGTLGLFILAISILALRHRNTGQPLKLPVFLLLLVCFQAALGMWTVTLNLLPVVVMGHLLGGFAVLSCLFLLYLRITPGVLTTEVNPVPISLALLGLGILVVQIALGGWTSANYASMACTELPVCEGQWWSQLDFSGAFSVPDAHNYEFGAHDYQERMTMHIVHRVGALVTFAYLLWLAVRLISSRSAPAFQAAGKMLLVVLCVQVALGISNVMFSLPLPVAVAHNAVAACLLLVMVWVAFTLKRNQGVSHV